MSDSIKILFCGDFAAHNSDKIIVSPELLFLFETSDINCCNFEAPIKSNGLPIAKSGSALFQSKNSPEFLIKIGFNLIQLANNHIFDYGQSGYEKTVTSFNNTLLVGAGKLSEAYKVKTITLKGKTFGFLALTHHEFGVLGSEAKSDEYGTAWINHPKVNALIIDAKKQLDYLFILPHAGIEMIDAPLPEWRNRYKEFIDLGADGIIASHPHIPQGWEVHRGKPIFYSLGNFYFDAIKNNHIYWNKGLIVELIISDDISYKVQNIIFNKNEIKIDKSESIQLHNLMLCNLLINEIDYFKYIDNQALDHWNSYECHFKRSLNTMIFSTKLKVLLRSFINSIIGKPNVYQLVNLMRCESHRWFVIRALELLMKERIRK